MEVLLVVALLLIILLSIGLYEKNTNAVCLSKKRLEGKTVIVTGGTAGMGLVIATDLAHRGAKVIIACPFEDEGIEARNTIIKETENENVHFILLDQASLDSTRKFASDILKTEDRLDILINNAGVGTPVVCTKDGMNFIMQVNYYGTFLLTLLLLPLLKKTGKPREPSRILTTASNLHMLGQVNIYEANQTKHTNYWNKVKFYANSKLFLILFANELTERLRGTNVVINNVDPGLVGTKIFNAINIVIGTIIRLSFVVFCKTPWYGAQTALHVALDKRAGEVSGAYFKNCAISKAVKRAYCDKTAKMLWKESVRLVKLTPEELDQCFKSS